jgi:hypothetical protein
MNLARPFLVVSALSLLVLGCPKKKTAGSDAGVVAEGGTSVEAKAREGGAAGDDVQPVYPVDPNAPPDPLAQKLCLGLTDMPEKKRAACCNVTPGIVVTSECTRTLSAALRSKAVELSAAAVDACIAAYEKSLEGCDWVGPFAAGPPPECRGIVTGVLSFGQQCRSSLECGGVLRCKGVGPTTPGHCTAPNGNGDVCGTTVDALATYVRQNDVDKTHPECAGGRCIKHRCATPARENEECQVTLDCDEGLQCVGAAGATAPRPAKKGKGGAAPPLRKCQKRPLPKEGEACPGAVCAGDLGCVMGKCTARKSGGADCMNDFECRGGCIRTEPNKPGKCGPRCDIR